jgi:hypothetical protein
MGRRCTVCVHPERNAIDLALARGGEQKATSRRYGLTRHAVSRHVLSGHVPVSLVQAHLETLAGGRKDLEAVEIEERDGLLMNLKRQRAMLLEMQERALVGEKWSVVTQISYVVHRNLEMVGRYFGQFQTVERKTVEHVLLRDPQYITLRSGLLEIARRHPQIRGELAELLRRVDGGAAYPTGTWPRRAPPGQAIEHVAAGV